ncbi:hypothetical protein CTN00_09075 [Fusobacterium pseudoperiodonticum]|nr:hypothetical protein CTN00_09075 [Fusobacterium pseudoperiodonticum]
MDSISLIMKYYSFLYVLVQINFTEKESQLQKIFFKSAIGFFYYSDCDSISNFKIYIEKIKENKNS